MNLLKITVGTLILLLLTVGLVRFYSLSKAHPTYDSGFLAAGGEASPQGFLLPPSETKVWTLEALQILAKEHPKVIIYAGVKKTVGGDLVLGGRDPENFKTNEQKAVPLGVALENLPQSRFILDILDNVENIHELVAGRIKNANAANRVVITSEFNVVITAIKDLLPKSMFGASIADRMRFNAFSSMFILPATPFKGDVYFTPPRHRNIVIINAEIAQELKRRGKPLFLGPVSEAEWEDSLKLNPQVIGTDNLELLVKKLSL